MEKELGRKMDMEEVKLRLKGLLLELIENQ
jgi:hypothetical protein